jgi:polysaccharide deacetylase family protein (PEP-CTERM system associated)
MASSSTPSHIFTVDLEEWFHVCGVSALAQTAWDRLPSRVELTTDRVLDLLDATGVRATFFVVGWVAERHPRLVERVRTAGHEIGSHSYAHQRAYDLGQNAFAEDLAASRSALAAVGVPDVRLFRAPEWSINGRSLWALDQLARQGFKADASMAPLKMVGDVGFPRHPHVRNTASGPILEIPPFVTDRLGQVMPMGWGWGLRMSSPRRVLRLLEAENRAGRPAVITLHPWEIDPDPPRVKLPVKLHFAHYFRLTGFADRLRDVLRGTTFGPLGAWASSEGYL